MASAGMGREESEEREQLLKSLAEKTALKKKLEAELEKYKSCDPERIKELRMCNIMMYRGKYPKLCVCI